MTNTDTVCCVEVRFLRELICRKETTDRGQAENYRDLMREMYWGAKVTIVDGTCAEPSEPLPTNPALWPLTVK